MYMGACRSLTAFSTIFIKLIWTILWANMNGKKSRSKIYKWHRGREQSMRCFVTNQLFTWSEASKVQCRITTKSIVSLLMNCNGQKFNRMASCSLVLTLSGVFSLAIEFSLCVGMIAKSVRCSILSINMT
jgi:hypothetical protein